MLKKFLLFFHLITGIFLFAQEINTNNYDDCLKKIAVNVTKMQIICMNDYVNRNIQGSEIKELLDENVALLENIQTAIVNKKTKEIHITYPFVRYLEDKFNTIMEENNNQYFGTGNKSIMIFNILDKTLDVILYWRIINSHYIINNSIAWNTYLIERHHDKTEYVLLKPEENITSIRKLVQNIQNICMETIVLSNSEIILSKNTILEQIFLVFDEINFIKTKLECENLFHVSLPILNTLSNELELMIQDVNNDNFITVVNKITQFDDLFISLIIIFDNYPLTVERSWVKIE